MTEGDVWFNTQKTTLHIVRGEMKYWCGLTVEPKHSKYHIKKIIDTSAHFCRRCVKIKMKWAWTK